MLSSAEIRSRFLEFFRSKDHTIVPSAPIVVKNDPTLLFTNAGMNQFKDYFLGNKKSPYRRVADTQKCLRVSGKHNDLEEVGVDTYHHTMFEMLGNWSFGDYFKNEAIDWSWELLTSVYNIPKDRIYATVFEGDKKEGIPPSTVALAKWKTLMPEDHIVFGNKKDNFWEMGDTGPCGPCSEIHVDLRPQEEIALVPGRELINKDHPQVIEIWNNVFIQYNRLKDGSLEPLPETHVDTGMGLERLVRVIQGKTSNYDTDLFSGTIQKTAEISGKQYNGTDSKTDVAFRVIADHIRAICFTIADGQLPSNTGAGYVIRRILRRAVRYYYSYLDVKQPLLVHLVPVLAIQFENVFPELFRQQEFVSKVVREEEEAFLRTLDKGLKKIDEMITTTRQSGTTTIPGKEAFELFDTYGFPIDLTRLIASEQKLTVDELAFEKEMLVQKERSRAAGVLDTDDWVVLRESGQPIFAGYTELETSTVVSRYRRVKSKGRESYQLILAKTPFYAESGGQVGDQGVLDFQGELVTVTDTKKENDLIISFVDKLPSAIDKPVIAKVDALRRKKITLHHSATHLLHAALRSVLGTHVEQKGSLVNDQQLRFDFSHFAKMNSEELLKTEQLVNDKIRENIPVIIKEMEKEEALQLGAMALFGEKYGNRVRVVIIDPSFSVELCGGTHAGSTGELGYFKITHESAVAAGVRRLEAITGPAAADFLQSQDKLVSDLKDFLKNPKDILKSVESLYAENAELKKKIEQLENKSLLSIKSDLLKKVQQQNGIDFIGEEVEVSNADALKKLYFDLKTSLNEHVVVLVSNIGGKPFVAIGFSDNVAVTKNLDAGKIIKQHIAPLIKGGGGGQKTLATAGGQDSSNLKQVIEKVRSLV